MSDYPQKPKRKSKTRFGFTRAEWHDVMWFIKCLMLAISIPMLNVFIIVGFGLPTLYLAYGLCAMLWFVLIRPSQKRKREI